MRIGIDISQAQYAGTGVARYMNALVPQLVEQARSDEYITLFYNSRHIPIEGLPLMSDLRALGYKKNYRIVTQKLPEKVLSAIWNKFHILPIETFIGSQDVYYYSDWFTPPTRARGITTVHDLVFRRYPETVDSYVRKAQESRLQFIQQRTPPLTICADSKSTRNDLLELYQLEPSRVHVVYPGVTVKRQTDLVVRDTLRKYNLAPKKYILAVGKREPRKNLDRLVAAYMGLPVEGIRLFIVGPSGWGKEHEHHVQRGESESVQTIGYVSDIELYALYQAAACFAYPTLYEGFGFPLAEALSLGCPSLASRESSLPEIGGKAALYCDPTDIVSIRDGLNTLLSQSQISEKKRIETGKKQMMAFTWSSAAKKVLQYMRAA